MERWNSLPLVLRQIILGAALFILGAGLSFAYSYRPLHGALTWKVSSLESRLDERNLENAKLRDELTKLEQIEKTRVDPETFAQVESELARTKSALKKSEKKVDSVDRKRRDANASTDRWRKRYEKLRDEAQAMPAAPAAIAVAPKPAAVSAEAVDTSTQPTNSVPLAADAPAAEDTPALP